MILPQPLDSRIFTRYASLIRGPVAQSGERHNGIVEVRGSSPLRSTPVASHIYSQVKGGLVAKRKRNLWEELLAAGRRMLKEVDDFLAASGPKAQPPRKPARVPVPIDKRQKR